MLTRRRAVQDRIREIERLRSERDLECIYEKYYAMERELEYALRKNEFVTQECESLRNQISVIDKGNLPETSTRLQSEIKNLMYQRDALIQQCIAADNLGERYETDMREARQTIERLGKEVSRLQIELRTAKQENADLKSKYAHKSSVSEYTFSQIEHRKLTTQIKWAINNRLHPDKNGNLSHELRSVLEDLLKELQGILGKLEKNT
jgi:predicted  nucleic acid-binding Zn-ribbon protein